MKAVIFTLGCKVNEAESAKIAAALDAEGWETDEKLCYADAYVLNTCAVTREAEKKSRQLIARVKKYNPDAKIFVCGCASEKDRESFTDKGAVFVCGAKDKDALLNAFSRVFGGSFGKPVFPKQTRTRAFIKIQDGCNNFCSYCIIPYLRGRETSRGIDEIKAEIEATSCPEIVLNGINISSYEGGLERLVNALSGTDKRIRLGSLECGAVTDGLLSSLKNLKDFAPQFHLSLQSGSSRVLKAMNRHYTREEYLKKCALIYSYFPDAAITTDIIAGFATETEQEFSESISIIKEAGFARVHAFAFSPREGTVAYKMQDVPADIKSARLHKLLAEAKSASEGFAESRLGKSYEIIAEDFDDGYTSGYTGNYIRVYVSGRLDAGKRYKVTLKELYKDGVIAQLNG